MKAPYASGRDWNKVEKLLEKEADEKKEGEAALNEMFQKIYADANDEVTILLSNSQDAKNCVYLVLTHQFIRFFFQ